MPSDRYHRQTLLPHIGAAGQEKLCAAKVLLVGCGALGTVIAEQLVRAGVGALRIADRDLVELTNLQRQVLFDESDARASVPKAVAAAQRLRAINSDVVIEPLVLDLHAGNVESVVALGTGDSVDLILDGTDNVQTRYLLNDVAVKHRVPWLYGACVGYEGRVMTIRSPKTACLRCLYPAPPAPETLPTCDTAGVLASASAIIASLQATAAIKLLTGNEQAVGNALLSVNVWENSFRALDVSNARDVNCVCCGQRRFDFLDAPPSQAAVALCGRNAVQVRPGGSARTIDLCSIAARLAPLGEVEVSNYFLRCRAQCEDGVSLTLFPDGRAIWHGTADLARARSLHAKWVGS